MSITDIFNHNHSIEANGTEIPGAEKQIANQFMKRHFNESNIAFSTWFRAWLACPLIVFASTSFCLSEGTEYPSDAYARPTVDSLPVFETLCGVQPALANPLERAAKFATHRFELVERKGVPAAEWEFRFDKDPCPPAMITVDERLNQVPQKVLLTVSNDGDVPIEVACIVGEVGWWTDQARKPLSASAVGAPAISPGQSQEVTFDFGPNSGGEKLRQPVTLALVVRDPKAGRTYKMALSNLRVQYGTDPRVATLGGSAPLTAGAEAVFSVKAQGIVPGEQLDLQVEDGRWTLWRIRMSEQEVLALVEKGEAEIRRKVPDYLPSRKASVSLVGRAGRLQASPLGIEIVNGSKPGFPEMKRKVVNGVPTFLKNGKPMPWSGYATFDFQPGNVNQFGKHGANLFSLVTNAGRHVHNVTRPTWQPDGSFDFRQLDEYAAMALAANSEANLLLRVSLSLPPWWFKDHPEDRVLVRKDGREVVWEETGGIAASFTSSAWREQQAKNLRTLIAYVQSQPWANRVVGMLLMGGVTEEWFAWASNDTQCGDYSPVQQQAFVRWCEAKGFPWKEIPPPEERMISGTDVYPDTDAGRRAAAYQQFNSDSTAETISYFAHVSKESAPQLMAGAFYGYTVQLAGEPRQSLSGHFALRQLLDDPQIDFLASVPLHNFRTRPDALETAFVSQGGCTASIRLAGKACLDENDLFSWLHHGLWHTLFDPNDPRAGAITMNRRILADDAVNGISRYWYSLLSNWHDDEQLQREFASMHRIQAESLGWDRTPQPEIGFLIDDTSFDWVTPHSKSFRLSNADFLFALAKSGAPIGVYLLSDVAKLPESIKLVVVANAVAADPEDLARLSSVIEKGGRKFLAVGSIGLINPLSQQWNLDAPAKWLGLPVATHAATRSGILRATATGSILVDAGPVNPYATAKEEGWATYVSANPADRALGGANRPLKGEGSLTWSSLPLTNVEAVRSFVLSSGARCYAPMGYVVNAAKGVVSVTAPVAGTVKLEFPSDGRWIDAFDGSTYTGGKFKCTFAKGQTRLFVPAKAEGKKRK
jgi:hypothetical protein